MERTRWKVPPAHKDRGRRETPCQRGHRTSSDVRILQTSVPIQDPTSPYVYIGNHPWGFDLYQHPLRGECRWLEGRFAGLTTDELDELEDARWAEQCARERDGFVSVANPSLCEIPVLSPINLSVHGRAMASLDRLMRREGVG